VEGGSGCCTMCGRSRGRSRTQARPRPLPLPSTPSAFLFRRGDVQKRGPKAIAIKAPLMISNVSESEQPREARILGRVAIGNSTSGAYEHIGRTPQPSRARDRRRRAHDPTRGT